MRSLIFVALVLFPLCSAAQAVPPPDGSLPPTVAERQREVAVLADEAAVWRRDIQAIIAERGISEAHGGALQLWARINLACTSKERPSLDRCPQAVSDIHVAYGTVRTQIAAGPVG